MAWCVARRTARSMPPSTMQRGPATSRRARWCYSPSSLRCSSRQRRVALWPRCSQRPTAPHSRPSPPRAPRKRSSPVWVPARAPACVPRAACCCARCTSRRPRARPRRRRAARQRRRARARAARRAAAAARHVGRAHAPVDAVLRRRARRGGVRLRPVRKGARTMMALLTLVSILHIAMAVVDIQPVFCAFRGLTAMGAFAALCLGHTARAFYAATLSSMAFAISTKLLGSDLGAAPASIGACSCVIV